MATQDTLTSDLNFIKPLNQNSQTIARNICMVIAAIEMIGNPFLAVVADYGHSYSGPTL